MSGARNAPVVAALDVGSSKVVAALALPEADGLRVLGVGQAPGAGVRRGAVVDVPAATAAIGLAVQRVRRVVGRPFPAIMLGSAAGEILSYNRDVEMELDPPGEVLANHVAELMAEVRRTPLPPGYQLVHAVPQEFMVDGFEGCTQPVGLAADRLGLSAHLVACQGTLLANLVQVALQAGLQVEDFAVGVLAAAESALSDEERAGGVVLVDIGATATQLAVVVGGQPVGSATVPLGGEHVTQAVAQGLRLALPAAEGVKQRLATADVRAATDRLLEGLPVDPPAEGAAADAPPLTERTLAEVVAAAAGEILAPVARLIQGAGLSQHLGAGAVLTGGGSRLRGIDALAMRTLGCRVRSGGALGAEGLLGSPECAACVGLLQLAAQRRTGGRRLPPVPGVVRRPWTLPAWLGGP